MPQQWYVTKDGRNRLGPYTWDMLRQMAADGSLQPADMTLFAGGLHWSPAGEMPGLFEAAPPRQPAKKYHIVAVLFAVFLGNFGAHKFYCGHVITGVLYACLFWTLIPAFLGVVDGLCLLALGQESFDRAYN